MIPYLCILIYVVYLCERIVHIGQTVCYAIFVTLFCIYLTIRLRAQDFYAVVVDEGEARINYHRIEIESE